MGLLRKGLKEWACTHCKCIQPKSSYGFCGIYTDGTQRYTGECISCRHKRRLSYNVGEKQKYKSTRVQLKSRKRKLPFNLESLPYVRKQTPKMSDEQRKINLKISQKKFFMTQRFRDWCFQHKLKKYNLTIQQYEEILLNQNGQCAICDIVLNTIEPKMRHIDHDHKTGKVRGVLCMRCNQALGLFREDSRLTQRATNYLKK